MALFAVGPKQRKVVHYKNNFSQKKQNNIVPEWEVFFFVSNFWRVIVIGRQ